MPNGFVTQNTKFELYFRDLNITHNRGHSVTFKGLKCKTTLMASLTFSDIGLHSGARDGAHSPAAADHGIWIKRTDITIGDPLIAARWDNVEQTQLCTKLVNDLGAEVSHS